MVAIIMVIVTIPFISKLIEFMPPLNEGTILYMPTTMPRDLCYRGSEFVSKKQDEILMSFRKFLVFTGRQVNPIQQLDPAPYQ